jgi:hypothetical protein
MIRQKEPAAASFQWMSVSPQPERLADVLRQLVALGSDPATDERPVAIGDSEGNEPAGTELGCEKVESKDRMSGISPLMSFTVACASPDSKPNSHPNAS